MPRSLSADVPQRLPSYDQTGLASERWRSRVIMSPEFGQVPKELASHATFPSGNVFVKEAAAAAAAAAAASSNVQSADEEITELVGDMQCSDQTIAGEEAVEASPLTSFNDGIGTWGTAVRPVPLSAGGKQTSDCSSHVSTGVKLASPPTLRTPAVDIHSPSFQQINNAMNTNVLNTQSTTAATTTTTTTTPPTAATTTAKAVPSSVPIGSATRTKLPDSEPELKAWARSLETLERDIRQKESEYLQKLTEVTRVETSMTWKSSSLDAKTHELAFKERSVNRAVDDLQKREAMLAKKMEAFAEESSRKEVDLRRRERLIQVKETELSEKRAHVSQMTIMLNSKISQMEQREASLTQWSRELELVEAEYVKKHNELKSDESRLLSLSQEIREQQTNLAETLQKAHDKQQQQQRQEQQQREEQQTGNICDFETSYQSTARILNLDDTMTEPPPREAIEVESNRSDDDDNDLPPTSSNDAQVEDLSLLGGVVTASLSSAVTGSESISTSSILPLARTGVAEL